jgi:hypothetical protein
MSPGKAVRIAAEEDVPKEGEVGTYSELQGPTGDRMTPDHEPQNALMESLADVRFRNRKVFKDTDVADYTMGQGICLNMFETRHEQTRTFKSRGSATKSAALGAIRDDLADLPANASDETARRTVANVVRKELSSDHAVVRDIYDSSRLSQKTKDRVATGLRRVWNQNRDRYPEAFEG